MKICDIERPHEQKTYALLLIGCKVLYMYRVYVIIIVIHCGY